MRFEKRPGEARPEKDEGPRSRSDAPDPAEARALGIPPTGHPAGEDPSGFRGAPSNAGDNSCAICGVEFHQAQDLEDHRAARHAGAGV